MLRVALPFGFLAACSSVDVVPSTEVDGAGGSDAGVSSANATNATAVGVGGSASMSSSGGAASAAGGAGGTSQPECSTPADCAGSDGECAWRACYNGVCDFAYAPATKVLAQQVEGDCFTAKCNGSGGVVLAYSASDVPTNAGECAEVECTPNGPAYEPHPDGEKCTSTCGCPEMNNGKCGKSGVSCTLGMCKAGKCVDAIPVQCKVGDKVYTRCNLQAGEHTIGWGAGTPECEAFGECACSMLALDVGYCAPGTTCYVNDKNGWLGPVNGTGVCQ